MKCVICRGDDIVKKLVDEEIKIGSDIVLVSMELLVCNGCGERYYDQRAMKKIEDLRAAMKVEELPTQAVVGKVYRAYAAS
ncbi:MAG TPA: YgiT-type zinc finger protein [Smithellaceae bacterium]|nr:YgiT-type zinc finger protein [Smithellaceae bacterium]